MKTLSNWLALVVAGGGFTAGGATPVGPVRAELPANGKPATALPKGHVLFQADFEGSNALRGWQGAGRLEAGCRSVQSLGLDSVPRGSGNARMMSFRLPADLMRGCIVRASAMVKATNVSTKPNPWNGIKFMLALESPERKLWPQAPLATGTFDWQNAVFSARIPPDATAVTLCLGLEQVTGQVWFDDLKISIAKPPTISKPAPLPGPRFKGHDLPRLRGAMVGPNIDEAGLRTFGRDWKANLIRWQLIRHGRPGQPSSLADYDAWLDGELKRLDAALEHCEKYGLFVVVDLHSPPGGKATASSYIGSDDRLFADRKAQDKLVEVWRRIATRYKDAKSVWGYDLANEPVEDLVEEGCDDWHDLAERTAKAIREIDPQRAIIVEAPPWGSPESLAEFTPISVSNVVYSAHMYVPAAFTHQGVFKPTEKPVVYPGRIEGKMWDRAALEAALKPVIEFQKNYNAHIYMGEFSAIRWAPGDSAGRYLSDVIEIFEQYGWDWSYHAFREWSGWSVEHGSDRSDTRPAAQPTDRQKLLQEWYGKNQKPAWAADKPPALH
jgi:endoglucanase